MDFAKIAEEAVAERSELLARVEKLNVLIATVNSLGWAATTHTPKASRPASQPRASSVMGATNDAVSNILRRAGRAMRTSELVPLVKDAGVDVAGKNAVATLSARLSNSDVFTNNSGIGWWFTGEDIPVLSGSIFDEAEGQHDQTQPSASVFQ